MKALLLLWVGSYGAGRGRECMRDMERERERERESERLWVAVRYLQARWPVSCRCEDIQLGWLRPCVCWPSSHSQTRVMPLYMGFNLYANLGEHVCLASALQVVTTAAGWPCYLGGVVPNLFCQTNHNIHARCIQANILHWQKSGCNSGCWNTLSILSISQCLEDKADLFRQIFQLSVRAAEYRQKKDCDL